MDVWLVRHGQASFDSADYDRLSALGEQQARALGTWLAGHGVQPAQVWHGGLQRQQRSAECCLAGAAAAGPAPALAPPLPVPQVDPAWREYDHREIFFAAHPALRAPAAMAAWLATPDEAGTRFATAWSQAQARWLSGRHPADYAEAWPDLRRRVLAALDRLVAPVPAGVIVVFTSAGPISAILQALQGHADAILPDLQHGLVNSSVTRLAQGGGGTGWTVVAVNQTVHLAAAGVTPSYR